MQTTHRFMLIDLLFVGIISSICVAAPIPTFSLEAATINDVPLPQGTATSIAVLPGDRLVLEVYIRDWSPKGQHLIACQAQMNPASYSSGKKGFIEPFGYNAARLAGTDNPTHCTIDLTHPKYIFKKKTTIPVTDTRSEGYRWLNAIINAEGPLSKQDGDRYYMGSIDMLVSGNAHGQFALSLINSKESCQILEMSGAQIMPIEVESLNVSVGTPTRHYAMRRLIDLANRPVGNMDILPEAGSVAHLLTNAIK